MNDSLVALRDQGDAMGWTVDKSHAGEELCSDLINGATQHPDKIAVIAENGQWSYAEFHTRVMEIGSALASQGFREGTRVLLVLEDRSLLLGAMFAVISSGGVAVLSRTKLSERNFKNLIDECRPGYIITTRQDAPRSFLSLKSFHFKRSIAADLQLWSPGSHRSAEEKEVEPSSSNPLGGRGIVMILYSSGVSDRPRGVILTSRSLLASRRNIMGSSNTGEPFRELITLSPSHPFGLGRIQGVFHRGGTVVLTKDSPSPEQMVENILSHSCVALTCHPADLLKFLGSHENLLQQIGEYIQAVNFAGSQIPVDFRLKLARLLPHTQIVLHYGPVEAPASTSLELQSELGHLDSVGRPTSITSIEVWSQDRRNAPHGQIGEIVVKGPHVSAGYWRDERLSAKRYTADQWLKTGDFGYVDSEGYLHLVGRRDDLIVTGGEPISPAEIESILRESYPALEPCVVGIPDPAGVLGQIPALCYVVPSGLEVTPIEIIETLADSIDEDKTPKLICCLDDFPREQNGKIVRREVERMLRKMTKEKKLKALMAFDSSADLSVGDPAFASQENLQLQLVSSARWEAR